MKAMILQRPSATDSAAHGAAQAEVQLRQKYKNDAALNDVVQTWTHKF